MKKIILLATYIAICSFAKSQDVVTFKDGDELKVKVVEVGTAEIRYKKFGSPDSPIYSLPKSEIFMIKYQDGTKDVFKDSKSEISDNKKVEPKQTKEKQVEPKPEEYKLDNSSIKQKGIVDAKKYYRASFGAVVGTEVVAIVSPLLGLIPAIACSSSPPREINLRMPSNEFYNNSTYINSYKEQAHKIKKKKVWLGYGIGAVTSVIISAIILGSAG